MGFTEARACSATGDEGLPHGIADLSVAYAQRSLPVNDSSGHRSDGSSFSINLRPFVPSRQPSSLLPLLVATGGLSSQSGCHLWTISQTVCNLPPQLS